MSTRPSLEEGEEVQVVEEEKLKEKVEEQVVEEEEVNEGHLPPMVWKKNSVGVRPE